MDFSNNNNQGDMNIIGEKVFQEESEELIFEETESDLDISENAYDAGDSEKKAGGMFKTTNILGFELEQNHILMIMAFLCILVFIFYKEQIMEYINELGLFNTTSPSNTQSV
tara:strand:- start:100 stop:435 length:336 start_codon:yes stop_codon:yes gene_type:complete